MSARETGSRPAAAYAREARRLDASTPPQIEGRIIHRERGISIGPFRLGYTSTDYEFDPIAGPPPHTVFADTLDAAATVIVLGESPVADHVPPENRPVPDRRQAMAGYRAAEGEAPFLIRRVVSGPASASEHRQATAGYQAAEEVTPEGISPVFCTTG